MIVRALQDTDLKILLDDFPKSDYTLLPKMADARVRPKSKELRERLASGRINPWSRTIFGSPQSKANSRKLVTIKGRPMFIKSDSARRYLDDFIKQCPILDPLFECDVTVEIDIYYESRRNDVDPSLIFDAMQGRIYRNDRQIRRHIITGYVDSDNPRAEIVIYPFEGSP